MEKRLLGKTGLEISQLSLGGMELRYLDESSADRLLNTALDEGINYIDTAPEYALSEYYIGQALAHRRSEFYIATKAGDNLTGVGAKYVYDKNTIMSNLEQSLRFLKTDYVDVLQLHGVIPEFLLGGLGSEAMEALRLAKKSGKARHIGLSIRNGQPNEYGYPATFAYNSLLRFCEWADIEVVQLVYGGMTRICENVIQYAHDNYGIGIVTRGAIKSYDDSYDKKYEASGISELFETGESKTSFLLRFSMSHPGVSSVVIGSKNVEHILDNIHAAERGILPDDIYQKAKDHLCYAGIIPGPVV